MWKPDFRLAAVIVIPSQASHAWRDKNLFRSELIELLKDLAGEPIAGLASHLVQPVGDAAVEHLVPDANHHAADQFRINRLAKPNLLVHQGAELLGDI